MNHRKYENRYVPCISFEKDVYDRLIALLPKDVAISDEINAYLKERIGELEGKMEMM